MPSTPARRRFPLAGAAAVGLLAVLVATAPADVFILKDGFVIQGTVHREKEAVVDKATGRTFVVPKASGFDVIDDGARLVVFSTHHKQLGEVGKDVKIRPDYKAYENRIDRRKGNRPFTGFLDVLDAPEFDDKWRRTLKVRVPAGFDLIEQQVTYLDPYSCFIVARSHLWAQTYRTSEMDPGQVRKLLATHPDLAEPDGKADPTKRVAIARFLKDVGWLYLAKEEIARLEKEAPKPWSKEATEEFDKFQKEMDVTTGSLVAGELELALAAGRYEYASGLLAAFPRDTADPRDLDQFTRVKAELETARDRYREGRRLLRVVIDDVTGLGAATPHAAVGGGPVVAVWPGTATLDTPTAALCAAAESVAAELHPDTAGRIEFFVSLAGQAEREKAQGKQPTKTPAELLATAVSGWAKGKNGATPVPDAALKVWRAREAVLAYQRGYTRNERNNALAKYTASGAIGLDELAQVVSLLPPARPEDLSDRTGELIPAGNGVPEGVYKRKTGSYNSHPTGIDYLVKLPPEYHHGRAYPVVVACSYPGLPPERLIGALAPEADKHGYILVAPVWYRPFDGRSAWEWKGEDHDFVTGPLRDVVRHFTVDNDRVFLLGAGEGADMAMDVGASHPDLFAGVVAVGPNPKWQGLFIDYWQNAQKLPFYVVTGQMAEGPNQNLRWVFEKWMPLGFPAIQVVYKGRGIEWFPAEVPVYFDWMGAEEAGERDGDPGVRPGPPLPVADQPDRGQPVLLARGTGDRPPPSGREHSAGAGRDPGRTVRRRTRGEPDLGLDAGDRQGVDLARAGDDRLGEAGVRPAQRPDPDRLEAAGAGTGHRGAAGRLLATRGPADAVPRPPRLPVLPVIARAGRATPPGRPCRGRGHRLSGVRPDGGCGTSST